MRPSKKKRRQLKASQASREADNGGGAGGGCGGGGGGGENQDDRRVIDCMNGVFASMSLEEEKGGGSSYASTSGSSLCFGSITGDDLSCFGSFTGDDPSTTSSSSAEEVIEMTKKGFGGSNKQKRIAVSTGIVSSVIGKDYVRSSASAQGRRNDARNRKVDRLMIEETEQFLCSMLGDECELSMAVVRDVLCDCGYDAEKALDILLDLSASTNGQFKDGSSGNYRQDFERDSRIMDDTSLKFQLPDRLSDSTSHLSGKEVRNILSSGYDCREYSEVLVGSTNHSLSMPQNTDSCLPQKVLECLFRMPKNSAQEPDSMNWKNIVKKMESFGQGLNARVDGPAELHQNMEWAKGKEYQVFRKTATQHYGAMKSYYQKAATAYSSGNKGHAAYLSEQGRVHNKIALEADEKASREIFEARNKAMQNVVTIDLHGQHVKQAIRLLKVHLLLFTTYIPSVKLLRVITGCGAHGVGRGKLKQSVIGLVKKAGVEWSEENRGMVLIKLDGQSDLSFLDSDGEVDS